MHTDWSMKDEKSVIINPPLFVQSFKNDTKAS